ncbi:glycosyltransferase family 2 protein, partial [Enterobacter cloacae]
GRFEIIVVDDASGDGTPVMLGDIAGSLPYPLRFFVQDANCGPSAARNRALREAQGRILLIAGDDILPEPN